MSDVVELNLPRRPVWPGIAAAIGAVVALLVGTWWGLTTPVGPDSFAIKQVYFGPGKGIKEDLYGPGLHLVIPGYERLHLFPRDLQALDFNSTEARIRSLRDDYKAAPAIRIQTSDGYQVTVDATILYRIEDPYEVVTKVGFGRAYEDKIVMRRSDKILREVMGQLVAEDFFNDNTRMAAADRARAQLADDLSEWGLQVWAVLIRDYSYDDRFQSIIESKKIEDQRLFKNRAEKVRETRLATKNEVLAERDAEIEVLRQEGDNKIRAIRADADTYYREQVAKGQKEVELAIADGQKWEREALEAAGASNLVGIEMAKALDGTEVIVVSTTGANGINPLDLDTLLEGW